MNYTRRQPLYNRIVRNEKRLLVSTCMLSDTFSLCAHAAMAVINNPKIICDFKRILLAATVINRNRGGAETIAEGICSVKIWLDGSNVEITCVIIALPFT